MNELFNIPETLSPRLAWMRRHGINSRLMPDDTWYVWNYSGLGHSLKQGRGNTEDEALTALAKQAGIKLWN